MRSAFYQLTIFGINYNDREYHSIRFLLFFGTWSFSVHAELIGAFTFFAAPLEPFAALSFWLLSFLFILVLLVSFQTIVPFAPFLLDCAIYYL